MLKIFVSVNPDKDTSPDTVKKVTYEPKLKTFEEDMMDSFGIKEDRTPAETYWY